MTLDPAYLQYPRRRAGYDHDLYPWSALHARPPVVWPNGKSVAVWLCVVLEYFPLTPGDAPFRAPGHMQTPYPDYRHYTAREYGTRIGLYRLLDLLRTLDIRASFATNAAIATRYPEIIVDILAAGHDIMAHSTDMNGTIASGLAVADERALVAASLDILEQATGRRPTGWLSIAQSQSFATLDILRNAGVEYCCDWVNDELPYRMTNGLINLPLNHELSDRQIMVVQQHGIDSYSQQITDAFEYLAHEARSGGGRMLPLQITPYISGLPYRMAGMTQLLTQLRQAPDAWFATGSEIVSHWRQQNP